MQNAKVNATGSGRIGVLIVNLGTPEATSYWPMRRYLKEFLSDPRVIETNRILWWFILNGIILTIRPKRSGHAYEKIWNRELNESPLKTITRSQAERLATEFRDDARVLIDWGMRYGSPPVGERLKALKDGGCERILVFRSIRNTAPRRPRRWPTRSSRPWKACAGSQPCASCRLTLPSRHILPRWRRVSATTSKH